MRSPTSHSGHFTPSGTGPAESAKSGGTTYTFASWSDGGARVHTITTPAVDTSYTATFTTMPPVRYGDADQDGAVGMSDLNTLVDWILGRVSPPSAGSTAFVSADVNGDVSVGMPDLNLLVDYILGRISKFPVE